MTETNKQTILHLISSGQKLPKELIHQRFSDEEDVFLFWNGRNEETSERHL